MSNKGVLLREGPSKPLTPEEMRKHRKKQEKEQKEQQRYWSSMITRKEAQEMVSQAIHQVHQDAEDAEERTRLLFIQVKTLTEFLIQKGMVTLEELDQLSIPVVKEIYGEAPTTNKGVNRSGQKRSQV